MSSLRRRAIVVQRARSTEGSSTGGRVSARTTAAESPGSASARSQAIVSRTSGRPKNAAEPATAEGDAALLERRGDQPALAAGARRRGRRCRAGPHSLGGEQLLDLAGDRLRLRPARSRSARSARRRLPDSSSRRQRPGHRAGGVRGRATVGRRRATRAERHRAIAGSVPARRSAAAGELAAGIRRHGRPRRRRGGPSAPCSGSQAAKTRPCGASSGSRPRRGRPASSSSSTSSQLEALAEHVREVGVAGQQAAELEHQLVLVEHARARA